VSWPDPCEGLCSCLEERAWIWPKGHCFSIKERRSVVILGREEGSVLGSHGAFVPTVRRT